MNFEQLISDNHIKASKSQLQLDIKSSILLNSQNLPIKTSSFLELIAVTQAQSNNTLFDIIINDEINVQTYCTALITKIF